MKKSLICLFLAVILLLALNLPAMAETDIQIYINGEQLSFSVAPAVVNGTTLVPLRAIFEALGAQVEWQSETKTITATKKAQAVILILDNRVAFKNGAAISLAVPPQIVSGRTLVPLRFISESFDCTVAWDPLKKKIEIATPDAGVFYFPIPDSQIPGLQNLYPGHDTYADSNYKPVTDLSYYGYYIDDLKDSPEQIALNYYYYLLENGCYFYGLPQKEDGMTQYYLISPDDKYIVVIWAKAYKDGNGPYHYLNITIYPNLPEGTAVTAAG